MDKKFNITKGEILNVNKETPGTLVEEGRSLSIKEKNENKELLSKIEKLEKQLETRNKLFSIISHDLKTPIENIPIAIDLLLEGVEDSTLSKEELVEMLKEISKDSKSTAKLFVDLIKWTKLQKEGINPKLEIMDLAIQVDYSIAPLILNAKEKEINLKNEITEKINIVGDPDMLQLVIRNLTSNAIKFTKRGGNIAISCEKENNSIKIYVKDDGVGLTEDQLNGFFENIGKSKKGTEGEEGTGLGLSFCKEMVEEMDGKISVESEGEGKGTKFTITLPAGENSAESK